MEDLHQSLSVTSSSTLVYMVYHEELHFACKCGSIHRRISKAFCLDLQTIPMVSHLSPLKIPPLTCHIYKTYQELMVECQLSEGTPRHTPEQALDLAPRDFL